MGDGRKADIRELELRVMVHRVTEQAFLVSETEDLQDAVWLPRSQVDDGDTAVAGEICDVLVPEWLAIQKGLV